MSSRRAWSVLCCPPARCERAAQVRRDVPPCRNAARARRVRGARRCAYYAIAAASAHGQAHMLFSSDYLGATSDVVRMDAASAPLLPARAAGMVWARRGRLAAPRRLYLENRAVVSTCCPHLSAPVGTASQTSPSAAFFLQWCREKEKKNGAAGAGRRPGRDGKGKGRNREEEGGSR